MNDTEISRKLTWILWLLSANLMVLAVGAAALVFGLLPKVVLCRAAATCRGYPPLKPEELIACYIAPFFAGFHAMFDNRRLSRDRGIIAMALAMGFVYGIVACQVARSLSAWRIRVIFEYVVLGRQPKAQEPTAHDRSRAAHAAEAMQVNGVIRFERQVDGIENPTHSIRCGDDSAVGDRESQVNDSLPMLNSCGSLEAERLGR